MRWLLLFSTLLQAATPAQVRVVLETELGSITVEVDAARAPVTAANVLRSDHHPASAPRRISWMTSAQGKRADRPDDRVSHDATPAVPTSAERVTFIVTLSRGVAASIAPLGAC
jgi:hypothetical protein